MPKTVLSIIFRLMQRSSAFKWAHSVKNTQKIICLLHKNHFHPKSGWYMEHVRVAVHVRLSQISQISLNE